MINWDLVCRLIAVPLADLFCSRTSGGEWFEKKPQERAKPSQAKQLRLCAYLASVELRTDAIRRAEGVISKCLLVRDFGSLGGSQLVLAVWSKALRVGET